EDRGVAAASHDRLIGNYDSRARFDGVVNLLRKLRVDAEARSDLLSRNAAAAAAHTHPTPLGSAGSKRALPIGCALKQRVDMVPKRTASVNLEGGAPDGIAIAIDVKRAIGGADDNCNRSTRASLRVPVIGVMRERTQHLRRKVLRREHQAGIRREMWHGGFAITYH